MQGFLSVMMMVLFIGLVVGLVKPSLVKMKSRWRVAGVWFVGSILLSLGLPKPEHTATPVVAEAKENVVAKQPTVKEENNQKSSALYDMFNKKEEKEVAPVVKVESKPKVKKSEKEEWVEDYTDELKVSFVKPFFMSYPSVKKFAGRYGEEKLNPMLFSIVDCVDKNAKEDKKHEMVDIIDACMRMELVKQSHTANKNTNEIKGWFTGGTLRMATIKEWKEATPENRLATTADWAGSIPGVIERLKETNFDFDAMKPFVQSIESCVDVCAKHAKKEDAPIRVCAYMCVKMVESKD